MSKNPALTHLKNLATRSSGVACIDGELCNPKSQDYDDIAQTGLSACIIDFVRLTGGQADQLPGTSKISIIANGLTGEIDLKMSVNRQIEADHANQQIAVPSNGLFFQATDFLSFYYWYNDAFKGKEAEHEI